MSERGRREGEERERRGGEGGGDGREGGGRERGIDGGTEKEQHLRSPSNRGGSSKRRGIVAAVETA